MRRGNELETKAVDVVEVISRLVQLSAFVGKRVLRHSELLLLKYADRINYFMCIYIIISVFYLAKVYVTLIIETDVFEWPLC